jgi:nicotinamidase-related amidase
MKNIQAIIVIDVTPFYTFELENNGKEYISAVSDYLKTVDCPVFYTYDSASKPHEEIKKINVEYDEIKKIDPSAFIETDLHEKLQAKKIKRIEILGICASCCVYSSVHHAVELGYDVVLNENLIDDCWIKKDKILTWIDRMNKLIAEGIPPL